MSICSIVSPSSASAGDITLQSNPYAALKSLPLSRHNLLYSLDHRNLCDEFNIGFMYCQNCSDGGRCARMCMY